MRPLDVRVLARMVVWRWQVGARALLGPDATGVQRLVWLRWLVATGRLVP